VSEIAMLSHVSSLASLRRDVRDSIWERFCMHILKSVLNIGERTSACHVLFFINSRLFYVTQHNIVGTHNAHRAHKQISSSGDCARQWGNFVLEARQGHYYVG